MTTIISSFLSMIDSAVLAMVQSAYGSLAANVASIFRAALLFYVVWWGYLILFGKTTAMPLEIVERIARVVFIYALATQWATFSVLVYDVVMKTPDAIGSAIMSAAGGTPGESGVVSAMNKVYESGAQLVARVYVGSYFDILGAILAGIVLIGMLAFIGAVMAILIATKLLLAGVLALAPVFIILAMFGYTFRFTDGYVRALVSLMVSMILVYAFLGVYAGLLDKAIQNVGNGGDLMAKIGVIAPYVFVCLCGFLVISQIPLISGTIAGGAASGLGAGLNAIRMTAPFAAATAAGAGAVGAAGFDRLRGLQLGGGGAGAAGSGSTYRAMQEGLKRIGRPPTLDGEVLPPVGRPQALTVQRALPGPPRRLPPPSGA